MIDWSRPLFTIGGVQRSVRGPITIEAQDQAGRVYKRECATGTFDRYEARDVVLFGVAARRCQRRWKRYARRHMR